MLFSSRAELILLVFVAYFQTISSECRQSVMTVCDTFEDFKNYTDKESLTELVIGSEHGPSNMTSVHLMRTLDLGSYHKLSTLMVIRAVNKIETTYAFQCTYYNSPLKYVFFYGNDLKTIESYNFPLADYKKLSLVNNKIESVKAWAFRSHNIENLDLSDNFLEVVETDALPQTDVAKIISIRNNKLTHVEPNSFPQSLESLNLDHNKLRYLQDEALEEVVNLRELTLSHNSFNVFPKIDHLTKLVVFDISHNAISTLKKGTFKDMDDLKLVDLSNNNIESDVVLEWLITPGKQPEFTISLGLNRLRDLDLSKVSLQKQTLVLYGNPWDCNGWSQLRQKLTDRQSECDLKFFADGSVPYCINYRSGGYAFVSLWEQDIDRFHETVKKSVKKAKCVLAPEIYHLLYPISGGCVA